MLHTITKIIVIIVSFLLHFFLKKKRKNNCLQKQSSFHMTSTFLKKLDKKNLKGGHRVMHIFMKIGDAKMFHVFAWGRFNKIDKLEVQDMGMKLLKRAMLCSTQRIYLSVCFNDDELASFCIQNSRTSNVCICIGSLCL